MRCVRRLFNVQVFPNTCRSLLNDGCDSDASARFGMHPIERVKSCIAGNIPGADMGAVVVMGIYPFFVDTSAGGLKQRTHLPVRPYILHRGKRTDAGTGAVVIPTHPFFVETSTGGLTQRTYLAGTSLHHASRKTYRRGYWDGGYFDASVLCGHIRRWVDTTDAPGRYVPTSHIAENVAAYLRKGRARQARPRLPSVGKIFSAGVLFPQRLYAPSQPL